MKISVIITTLLVAQVSASLLDVFHGAVLSVQNSFGKLLSDVVTDVKDTVDCTILAVEHVLSLSPDATIRYYEKCGRATNKTDSVSVTRQDASLPKVEVTLNLPNNEKYQEGTIPAEIDARINETLSKVLDNYKPHDNVLSIENVMVKESEQLAGVSALVKKELDKLTNNVTSELKNIDQQKDSQPSVDAILQEIKVLENRELNTKNASEAYEIHQVIDQVLDKLDIIEATETTENIKLEEIIKDLENNSNNSFVGLRYQFEEWKEEESRHLSEIKSKIEEHEKITDHPGSYSRDEFNETQADIYSDGYDLILDSSEISNQVKETLENTTTSKMEYNNKHLYTTVPEPSFYPRNTLNESELIDLTDSVMSASYSNTDRLLGSEAIREFNDELTTSSTTPQSNVTGDGTNETVTNGTLLNIDYAPVHSVDSITDSDKQQSFTASEPTISKYFILSTSTTSKSLPSLTPLIDMELNDTRVVSSSVFQDVSIPVNETSALFEMKTTTLRIVDNTPVSESIQAIETTTGSSSLESTKRILHVNSNDTIIASTYITENKTEVDAVQNEENSTTSGNENSSTGTTKVFNDNDFINTMTDSDFSPIENKSVSEISEPEEITTAFDNEESLNDSHKTMMRTFLKILESSPVSHTNQPEENKSASNGESTDISTTKIINESDSDAIITSIATPIMSPSESETIQAVYSATVSTSEESLDLTTDTLNKADEDALTTVITSSDANVAAVIISSTQLPISEFGTVSDMVGLVETTTPIEKIETSISSTNQTTAISDENNSNDTVTENTDSTVVTEIIEIAETTTASEEPDLLSTSTSTQSVVNENDITTALPHTEHISHISESIIASRNGNDSSNTTVEENAFTTYSKFLNVPDLNDMITSPPLTITDGPPVSSEWLTPNQVTQQNYDTNGASRVDYHFNVPILLSDRVLQTRQPLINSEAPYEFPIYSQAVMPPITRGLFNDQQTKIENDAIQEAALQIYDSMDERLLHSDSPFNPEEDSPKNANIPLITNAQSMISENPAFVSTPQHDISPSYSYDDTVLTNTYMTPERGLTTHRPRRTAARENKIPPIMDYDSFFHMPQSSEAHQRALQEARQLIANSKRSDRIINSIMKNKNKYKPRSIFNR